MRKLGAELRAPGVRLRGLIANGLRTKAYGLSAEVRGRSAEVGARSAEVMGRSAEVGGSKCGSRRLISSRSHNF